MENKRFQSLAAFYPFYLKEHRNSTCRKLHFAGTSGFFLFLFSYVLTQEWPFLIAMPLCGYGFAWVGHFFYEKNKPATFQYPLYSLLSDFKLYFEILSGKESFNPHYE